MIQFPLLVGTVIFDMHSGPQFIEITFETMFRRFQCHFTGIVHLSGGNGHGVEHIVYGREEPPL